MNMLSPNQQDHKKQIIVNISGMQTENQPAKRMSFRAEWNEFTS